MPKNICLHESAEELDADDMNHQSWIHCFDCDTEDWVSWPVETLEDVL